MWRTASTKVDKRDPRTARVTGRITSAPRHGPAGDLHAYRPGEPTTACGLDLTPLRLWPTYAFRRETSRHRCRRCLDELGR